MSRGMGFPIMWYVRQAKAQTSLRIRAVWSEPLLVAWVFYECLATDRTGFWVSNLTGGCTGSSESTLVKCHIVGNNMSQLICVFVANKAWHIIGINPYIRQHSDFGPYRFCGNPSNKCPCWRIQWILRSKIWSESSSTPILGVCEQR